MLILCVYYNIAMNYFRNSRGTVYKQEAKWKDKKDKPSKDIKGNPLPFPKHKTKQWQNQDVFIRKLSDTQVFLKRKNKYTKYDKTANPNCLLCDAKNIKRGFFDSNRIRWDDDLLHYIKVHNVMPSSEFLDFIFRFQTNPRLKRIKPLRNALQLKGIQFKQYDKVYLKLDRNQIFIMDALMRHGSKRIYTDRFNKEHFKYSEHSGILDFNTKGLEKIIISAVSGRIDVHDDDIYLPQNMIDALDYEYIFHTHPPTHGIAGRIVEGILYEFPSRSDVLHFVDHHNDGRTQGSIIVAPEGLYIIRKLKHDLKPIKMNENLFFKSFSSVHDKIQKDAIKKYTHSISGSDSIEYNDFYSKVAQDKSFIDRLNNIMNTFQLHIDYYPRIKDIKGRWIIDTVYLPVYVVEEE